MMIKAGQILSFDKELENTSGYSASLLLKSVGGAVGRYSSVLTRLRISVDCYHRNDL